MISTKIMEMVTMKSGILIITDRIRRITKMKNNIVWGGGGGI